VLYGILFKFFIQIHSIKFRLQVKGNDWNEPNFKYHAGKIFETERQKRRNDTSLCILWHRPLRLPRNEVPELSQSLHLSVFHGIKKPAENSTGSFYFLLFIN
jgi:hypothetical protein